MLSCMVSVAKTGSCSTTQAQCSTHAYTTHSHTHAQQTCAHTHAHRHLYIVEMC